MLFADIIGQEKIKKKLIRTVQENRISHAWLFFGPEGCGSLPLSLAYARYITCLNRNEDDSCGTCSSCRKFDRFIHPDLHFTFPINTSKRSERDNVTCEDFFPEWRDFLVRNPYGSLAQWYDHIDLDNKQGIIGNEESKRLTGKLIYKSFESDFKISIIWYPERMNDQAANRLLKLIEEPPPMTVLILAGENPDLLLPTIRSRCVNLKIPAPSAEALSDALMVRHGADRQMAERLTRITMGNYSKCLKILADNECNRFNLEKFIELMRQCYLNKSGSILKVVEDLTQLNREKQKSFLEYSLGLVRESLATHFGQPDIQYTTQDEQQFLVRFHPFINEHNAGMISDEFNKAILDIERNANGRIVLFDLALKLSSLLTSAEKNEVTGRFRI